MGTVHQADTSGVDCSLTPMFVERGKESVPDVTWQDANGLIESIRYMKSEEEIALMQQCNDIGDRAFLETAQFAKSGVASRAVYSRLAVRADGKRIGQGSSSSGMRAPVRFTACGFPMGTSYSPDTSS